MLACPSRVKNQTKMWITSYCLAGDYIIVMGSIEFVWNAAHDPRVHSFPTLGVKRKK